MIFVFLIILCIIYFKCRSRSSWSRCADRESWDIQNYMEGSLVRRDRISEQTFWRLSRLNFTRYGGRAIIWCLIEEWSILFVGLLSDKESNCQLDLSGRRSAYWARTIYVCIFPSRFGVSVQGLAKCWRSFLWDERALKTCLLVCPLSILHMAVSFDAFNRNSSC